MMLNAVEKKCNIAVVIIINDNNKSNRKINEVRECEGKGGDMWCQERARLTFDALVWMSFLTLLNILRWSKT